MRIYEKKVLYMEIKCIEEPFRWTILNREKRGEWNLFNKSNRTEFSCGSILSILILPQEAGEEEEQKKSHTILKTIRRAIYNQKRLFTFIRPKACVSHSVQLDTAKIIDLIYNLLSSHRDTTAPSHLFLLYLFTLVLSLFIYRCVYIRTFYLESMTTNCFRVKFKSFSPMTFFLRRLVLRIENYRMPTNKQK